MSKIQNLIKEFHASNNDKKIYANIIKELQESQTLWIAFSPITKNYYVDYVQGSPSAFIFSEKSYCEKYCSHMKESGFSIQPSESSKKDRLTHLADIFRSGFESVIIDNGKVFLVMDLFDLINKPDYSNLKPEERPLVNTSLVCSANRFFQSAENKTITKDKELNMLVDTFSAKYMIPFINMDEEKNITIPGITRNDGKKLVPFFTDLTELKKFDREDKFQHAITDFKQIQKFCNDGELVVINPFGFNFTLDKNACDAVMNAVNSLPDTDPTNRAVVFNFDKEPVEMTSKLNLILNNTDKINAAYIKGIRKNKQLGYLVVLDCGENDAAQTVKEFAEIAKTVTKEIPMEYVPLNSDVGQIAAADTKPFFEKLILKFSEE